MKTRIRIILFMLVFLTGCSGLRISYYNIDGDNIKYGYAKGDADVLVKSITAWSLFKSMPDIKEQGIYNVKEDKDEPKQPAG